MLYAKTRWPRLYVAAALAGAAFGLLLALGALPTAPEWPGRWGVIPAVAGGTLVALLLAGAAHLGVRLQLRARPGTRER